MEEIPLKGQEQPWTLCELPRGSSYWSPPWLPLCGRSSGKVARTGKEVGPCQENLFSRTLNVWAEKQYYNHCKYICTNIAKAYQNIFYHSIFAECFTISVMVPPQQRLVEMKFPILCLKFLFPKIKPCRETQSESHHKITKSSEIPHPMSSPQPSLVESHCQNTPLSIVLQPHLTKSLEKKMS